MSPECAALAFGAAGVGLGAAAMDIRRQFSIRGLRLLKAAPPARQERGRHLGIAAVLGAFVFAAQMFNVPVLPGISAHLVGGLLLAWMVGPSLGAWTMALVLMVQAIVLGDGGLASLGANIVNMALLPAGTVYLLRRFECQRISAAAGAAALTVVLAALLIPLETALFRSAGELAGWSDFASRMLLSHLAAGAVEGMLTLALLLALAPTKVHGAGTRATWQTTLLRSAFCLALIAGLFACSTELPDGYEAAAESSGLSWLLK
ncbi:MAG: energy-coupling factor ABC transporter permease [Planctomycetales bacterium]|nr:energy-coupling factor ABC transporter permease [Planctomycetales bacterium]